MQKAAHLVGLSESLISFALKLWKDWPANESPWLVVIGDLVSPIPASMSPV